MNQNDVITSKKKIMKFLDPNNNLPSNWGFPKELVPIDYATYIKEFDGPWSVKGKFTLNKEYPIYHHEESEFVISDQGEALKVSPPASWKYRHEFLWEDIYYFLSDISNTGNFEQCIQARKLKQRIDELSNY